tara:strand:- start:289 stop:618 length:330 start_codon:yes stop_codon:yes gene_type:complete
MDIYNDALQIIEDKNNNTLNDIKSKWNTFNVKYPVLFNMLLSEKNIDLSILNFMCQKINNLSNLSKEEKLEEDIGVGEELAKKFIYTSFPEPSEQQREFIKETLKKKLN